MTSINYFVTQNQGSEVSKNKSSNKSNTVKIAGIVVAIALILASVFASINPIFAGSATDEILDYEITVTPLEDATVSLSYHIEWKVLTTKNIGPLEWVSIGMPNSSFVDYTAYSANIRKIELDGSYVNVYFTDKYYDNEVVSFDFEVVMDDMFEVDSTNSSQLSFYFTPGWFDGIAVDKLVIKWKTTDLLNHSSGGFEEGEYIVWETSLSAGKKFSVDATYSMDSFDLSRYEGDSGYNGGGYNGGGNSSSSASAFLGIIFWVIIIVLIIRAKKKKAEREYDEGSGFENTKTQSKVTRTKVVYFDECPSCGAPHKEGCDVCEYCGRSMIQSEEVLEEADIKDEDKEALKYSDNGVFHYGMNPNTFVRVNVVHIPVAPASAGRPMGGTGAARPAGGANHAPSGNARPLGSSGKSTSRGSIHSGGRGTGGCVHSSCACACVSCACACACAGGGRAGCSTKDFYKSSLKMEQLRKKCSKK